MLLTSLLANITDQPSKIMITKDWAQGRACFGGLSAALVYQSMSEAIHHSAPLRSLQVSFVGPIAPEEFLVESEVLRQGKSVSQVLGRGIQNGETQIAVMGSFGKPRESVIKVDAESRVFEEKPDELKPFPFIEGVIPEFTKHFDFRYCTQIPFTNAKETYLRGFVRFKQPEPDMQLAHLIALVDAWPPTVLPMLSKPAPASSLSWGMEFFQPSPGLGPLEYCQYEAHIEYAADGYATTRAKIWNQSGDLLATSQQVVTAFA